MNGLVGLGKKHFMCNHDGLSVRRRDLLCPQSPTFPLTPILGEVRRRKQSLKCELEYLYTSCCWGVSQVSFLYRTFLFNVIYFILNVVEQIYTLFCPS